MTDLLSLGLRPETAAAFHALGAPDLLLARVASAPGGRWRVVTALGERIAEPAGRLLADAREAADLPAVGDWVAVRPRAGDDRATLVALLPRATALVRKVAGRGVAARVIAANVDVVLLACALDDDWNPGRLERWLAVAWESGGRPLVLLTKADVADDLAARVAEAEAVAGGCDVLAVSARTGLGLDALPRLLRATETGAIVGSSGVGKSTLLNRLLGTEAQATREVRESDGRGRHTTSSREMFALPWGAWLVDTPGLREVAVRTGGDAVDAAFEDVRALAATRRFRDCAHGPEPGCAVTAAVASGALAAERLEDWRHLRREQEFLARKEDPALARAAREKWKAIGKAGRAAMRAKRPGWDRRG